MAHEIEVVCKRNEARSPFLAAFLMLHLPESVMSSSGVSPTPLNFNNLIAEKIAAEWGFGYRRAKVKATSVEVGTRLHFPVDSFVQSELEKILKPEQILNLDIARDSSTIFTPLDPVNCTQNEMKYELAKLISFGVLQLRQFVTAGFPSNIEAIIPQNPTSSSHIFSDLLNRRIRENLIIVDASFKEPNRTLIKGPDGTLQVPLEPPLQGAIYSPIFEYPEPEKLLCSVHWRDWLSHLTEFGKVIIVTPPLVDAEGNMIHDSHLAAIWAENRTLI